MGKYRKSIGPLALVIFGGLLILGALVWYLVTFIRQPTPTPLSTEIVEGTYPEIPRVSLKDAKAAFDIGNAVFLDVRDAESYAQSHIKGAISIPLQDLSARIEELNPKSWIIPYCT